MQRHLTCGASSSLQIHTQHVCKVPHCGSGVMLNYWLDEKIESPGFLFGGAGLAAVALFLCTLARLEHDKSLRRSGSDAASLSSSINMLAAGMPHCLPESTMHACSHPCCSHAHACTPVTVHQAHAYACRPSRWGLVHPNSGGWPSAAGSRACGGHIGAPIIAGSAACGAGSATERSEEEACAQQHLARRC